MEGDYLPENDISIAYRDDYRKSVYTLLTIASCRSVFYNTMQFNGNETPTSANIVWSAIFQFQRRELSMNERN